jgi:hypothetical protein
VLARAVLRKGRQPVALGTASNHITKAAMYVLKRDINLGNGITLSKGTRLSDVYEAGTNKTHAIAHPAVGGQIKLMLHPSDVKTVS